INDGCGATQPEALQRAVAEYRADLGLALDGDADRLIVVDATGRVFNGDELLYVIVRSRLAAGPVAGAVGTLMSNLALERAMARLGVEFARAKVGDRYVLELLREKGWQFGGESSGHLLCLDCHTTGDGTISALQVLGAMRSSGRTLAELTEELTLYPQELINVRTAPGFDWQAHEGLKAACREVEEEWGDQAGIVGSASGTERLLRLMVEARKAEVARQLAKRLADSLQD